VYVDVGPTICGSQVSKRLGSREQKSKELNEIRRVHDERTRRSEPKERQRRNMIVRLDTIKRTAGAADVRHCHADVPGVCAK